MPPVAITSCHPARMVRLTWKSDSSVLKQHRNLTGSDKPSLQNLIHLPDEPAGVLSNSIVPSLATESRSPATRGGRGRRKPCRAPSNREIDVLRTTSRNMLPLRLDIHGVQRLAARHEQAIAFRTAQD